MSTAFTLKLKSEFEVARKVRKTWGFMPATKVFKSKKAYSRAESRRIAKSAY